jgi:hypothetical protein
MAIWAGVEGGELADDSGVEASDGGIGFGIVGGLGRGLGGEAVIGVVVVDEEGVAGNGGEDGEGIAIGLGDVGVEEGEQLGQEGQRPAQGDDQGQVLSHQSVTSHSSAPMTVGCPTGRRRKGWRRCVKIHHCPSSPCSPISVPSLNHVRHLSPLRGRRQHVHRCRR